MSGFQINPVFGCLVFRWLLYMIFIYDVKCPLDRLNVTDGSWAGPLAHLNYVGRLIVDKDQGLWSGILS